MLHSETRNGEKVQITVTLTNELPPTSPVCIQFYNIIFRRQVLVDKSISSVVTAEIKGNAETLGEVCAKFMLNMKAKLEANMCW